MEAFGCEWNDAPHSMGTTIMAVQYDGGVILGADSRTTTGMSLLDATGRAASSRKFPFINALLVAATIATMAAGE